MSQPLLVVIAGPNGAGKSTFYTTFLSGLGQPFLNADRLALETGMGAYEAAEAIAKARRALVERRLSFVTETVLSDPVGERVAFLASAAAAGFDVQLIFIGVADAQMSAARVASRVQAGGHDVPLQKLMARYARTLDNLERAIAALPRVMVYDNSSFEEPYRFVAEFRAGNLHEQAEIPPPRWARRFFSLSK